ncbi:unnamed protein product, partial [Oikopleura dioica]
KTRMEYSRAIRWRQQGATLLFQKYLKTG